MAALYSVRTIELMAANDNKKELLRIEEAYEKARLANPTARAMIETLDHAQRTNTIGTLSAEDVSRTIIAPAVIARNSQTQQQAQQKVIHVGVDTSQTDATLREVSSVIADLKRRLDEPFVTVNSVTGDLGMKQAQDEYERLMRNKSPKTWRK